MTATDNTRHSRAEVTTDTDALLAKTQALRKAIREHNEFMESRARSIYISNMLMLFALICACIFIITLVVLL